MSAEDSRFAIFDAWVDAQKSRAAASRNKRDQFSDRTATIYASIWRGWVEALDARGITWPEATAADVQAFLAGPAPAPKGRRTRAPIQASVMANYTQQRYWRVLQGVYAHAAANADIERNPCAGVALRPRVDAKSLQRRVLPSGALARLRNPVWLAKALPMKNVEQWWVLRDRAAVALVAHCGLTAAELIALRGADLRAGIQVLAGGPAQAGLPGLESELTRGAAVDVRGPENDPQARSVPLPPKAMAVLQPWLERRAVLLHMQQVSFQMRAASSHAGRPALAAAPLQPLLLSREAPGGQAMPAIDPATVYNIFQRSLDATLTAGGHRRRGQSGQEGDYVPRGPSSVRNSVIAEWAATLPVEQAAALAGVQPRALRAGHAGEGVASPIGQPASASAGPAVHCVGGRRTIIDPELEQGE